MEKKNSLKAAAFAAGAAMIASVPAQASIFEANDLGSGSELRQELTSNTDAAFVSNAELKCGEGSCGEKEGKEKAATKKAAKGETKEKAAESKSEEHKCGEGKCGESTCGGK